MTRPPAGPDIERIAVIGASLAGLNATETLRAEGYDGTITLVGAEDRLPYDRPPLSKQVLTGEREPDSTALRTDERYDELDLELRLGTRATALDPAAHEVTLNGGTGSTGSTGSTVLAYDRLIIATGASPRALPGTPPLDGIYTLRTIEDCIALRREFEAGARVVVVGAGFIGGEVAASARARGLNVTVLEAAPVPLERAVGAEMGRVCAALHTTHGVDLRLGTGVEGFDGTQRVERVRLADGSTLAADVVVVGVGVAPNVDWLDGSGIAIDNGITCDATLATSAPDVYAAGDVANWLNPQFGERMRAEHWTNAVEQGRAAALNVLAGSEDASPFSSVPYFWSDQYETKIQFVGHARPDDEVRVVHGSVDVGSPGDGTPADGRFVALYGRGGRLVAAIGFNWARHVMAYRAMIGEGIGWDDALAHAASVD